MFKRTKEPEKKGSEKREDLLVSFLKDAHFVFAIINCCNFILRANVILEYGKRNFHLIPIGQSGSAVPALSCVV